MDDVEAGEARWRAARAGDAASFGLIFDEHHERVYRHALRLVLRQHDAEDATAAAFLELWRRRSDVRLVDGSVLPWLLVTTTNVALNLRRSTRRHRRLLERLPRSAEGECDPSDTVASRADHVAGRSPLARALAVLSDKDRSLLCLVTLEGYSVREAGRVVGLSESAAKTRLSRTRGRLRGLWSEAAPAEGARS